MNFDFSDEQQMLRDEVRKFLVKESPVHVARQVLEQRGHYSAPVWNGLVQIGATALMLPEACGGAGLGALELCIVAEEAGRQLSPVPLASTLYLAAQALLLGAGSAQQQRWLGRIGAGAVATLAAPLDGAGWGESPAPRPRFDGRALHGSAALVADAGAAAFAVVLADDADGAPVCVVADLGTGVTRRALATLDPARPWAALDFDAVPAEALDGGADALALIERVRDRAAILLAFEQLGGADAVLEMSAAYARERKAFGRAIGSYQGIKHKLADLYAANQLARVHAYYGAWALAADAQGAGRAPALRRAAAAARVSASLAFGQAAVESIQVHGGMGYTWEMDCHLYVRRARHSALALGSVHEWRERLAAALEEQG